MAYSLRHIPAPRTRCRPQPNGCQRHIPCDTLLVVADVLPIPQPAPSLQEAIDAFLAQPDLAATSRRSYAQTTGRLVRAFGTEQLVAELVPAAVAATVERAWGRHSPRTWNRHLSALGSFVAFCRRRGWPVGDLVASLDRRREKADNTRILSFLELDRLWSRESVGLRERCMWRLLYETAARADEVLSLNVEDVDVANKRVVVISKGGDRELLHFQTGSARLLARPTLPRRPAAGPVASARDRGHLPGDRPGPTLLPAGRGALCRRHPRPDSARPAQGRTDPPRGGQRLAPAADGEEQAQEPALPAALRPSQSGGGRSANRPARPRPPQAAPWLGAARPCRTATPASECAWSTSTTSACAT